MSEIILYISICAIACLIVAIGVVCVYNKGKISGYTDGLIDGYFYAKGGAELRDKLRSHADVDEL